MLKLENVSSGTNYYSAVKSVSIEVKPGEKLVVSGYIKTGKTLLLKTAAGLISPLSGSVSFNNVNVDSSRQNHICFIPQDILPAIKTELIISAIRENVHCIIADEPFAFLNITQQNELQDIMKLYEGCLLISETSAFPVYRPGFDTYHLTSEKTLFSEENKAFM